MTLLTSRFDEALLYARAIHGGQKRKGTTVPYVAHLLGVAALALEAGADEEQAIAALLHDAVEDQGGLPRLDDIRIRFGDRVAEIVHACSDSHSEPKPGWRERKETYLACIAEKSSAALLVSLADKTYNAEAILTDLRALGDALWDRFAGGRDGTLWYYEQLAQAFARLLPGSASDWLTHAVAAMHSEARAASRP